MGKQYAFHFENEVLIALCIMAYLANMIELVKNDKVDVNLYDWVFNAFTGIIGGVVAYYTALAWLNIGLRMGLTIIISLISPRLIRFINTPEYHAAMAEGIGNGIINLIKGLFKGQPPNPKNDHYGTNDEH